MPGKRREREDVEPAKKAKKLKFADDGPKSTLTQAPVEIDFPRGGGTTFTPLEYKTIRAEAAKEADAELLFESAKKPGKQRKSRESDAKSLKGLKGVDEKKKSETIRVEHLNYKRLAEGMKVFCNIIAIRPLALIVSLPCQLVGHVPITHISTQLTKQLEASDAAADEPTESDDEDTRLQKAPELFEIFRTGQYVRAIVTAVRPPGSTARDIIGLRHKMDEVERACQRVELSLMPEQVNAGVSKKDLAMGFTLPAAVQSVEDHGYILDLGVPSVTGFLSFKDSQKGSHVDKLPIGHVFDVFVSNVSDNGRTCSVSVDPKLITSSSLSHITNVTSVLPGTLVQALVTAVVPSGLNVLVLGYFQGTIDLFHLPPGDIAAQYKLGQKIKARILWDMIATEPRKFALSLLPHTISLDVPRLNDKQLVQDAFSIGTTLEVVKVHRVETERGLVVEIQDGTFGYVHIRHVSDSHVPSLSPTSGPWKIGTVHRARVVGFHALDGILQLSLQKSVLEMRFLRVADVEVGEVLKATVKKLTSTGLFVSLSGNVDGVIWPNHYADITLKHPQKRFKEGGTVKCRVLVVDPDRERIVLTAKRALVESDLPVITRLEGVQPGTVTHAVVFKVLEKAILVEFYNNLRAHVSLREVSETPLVNLADAFPVGKPVKVRILRVDQESGRISASIRQADSKLAEAPDVHGVQIGEIVQGPIQAIHKNHAVVNLEPTGITALLSLKNLAYDRGTTVEQLRTQLLVGERLEDLTVASQNPDKGIVLVNKRPKVKEDDVEVINMDNDETELPPPSSPELPRSMETPTLNIQGGFRWSYQPAESEGAEAISASDSDDKAHPNTTKITKKKKNAIEYDLTADMHNRQPESTADFERLLLGSPNSSYLWVQYMSFQLQLSEIDKAREVGKRALRTINFREESEKLNVWIALLNLENKFGTDDTLEAVFKDAARHNDSKTIHLRLASIFDETARHHRATEQYQRTCKKFGKSSKVWSSFGEYYLKRGNLDMARQLLPRSLQSLEKRKHLKTIIKFSQLEYKLGEPEHGRTIFEGIVESHPKRWDLWSIYLDMEVTQQNIQGVRNIFSRLFALKMTSHKAKAFFKKWLEIEKRIGDIDGENMVKTKAVEWTGRASASAG